MVGRCSMSLASQIKPNHMLRNVAQLVERAHRKTAWAVLEHLLALCPPKSTRVLAHNGIQFAGQPRNRDRITAHLLARSMATKRWRLPSSVLISTMSIWKEPIGYRELLALGLVASKGRLQRLATAKCHVAGNVAEDSDAQKTASGAGSTAAMHGDSPLAARACAAGTQPPPRLRLREERLRQGLSARS